MPLSGPLFKFALLQTRIDEFYFFMCCHHIVVDGIGIGLFVIGLQLSILRLLAGESIPPGFSGR